MLLGEGIAKPMLGFAKPGFIDVVVVVIVGVVCKIEWP